MDSNRSQSSIARSAKAYKPGEAMAARQWQQSSSNLFATADPLDFPTLLNDWRRLREQDREKIMIEDGIDIAVSSTDPNDPHWGTREIFSMMGETIADAEKAYAVSLSQEGDHAVACTSGLTAFRAALDRLAAIHAHAAIMNALSRTIREDAFAISFANADNVASATPGIGPTYRDADILDRMNAFTVALSIDPNATTQEIATHTINCFKADQEIEPEKIWRERVSLDKLSESGVVEKGLSGLSKPNFAASLVEREVFYQTIAAANLSPRETEAIEGFLRGEELADTAQRLHLSIGTVKAHRSTAYKKLRPLLEAT